MNNFCLIGYPLGHSMSPVIHNELFKLKGINANYSLNEVAPENLKEKYSDLKKLDGFNVPFRTKPKSYLCLILYHKGQSFSVP